MVDIEENANQNTQEGGRVLEDRVRVRCALAAEPVNEGMLPVPFSVPTVVVGAPAKNGI